MQTPLRVIDDGSHSGAYNMAVDAVLLESAVAEDVATLRWYRWDEPTLSLGYFQSRDDRLIEDRFVNLPQVRRLSGGGAILHDRELTYSCAIGPTHPLAARPSELYRLMHAAIAQVFSQRDVVLAPRGETDRRLDANFLCFSRGDANDLICAGHKVLGSAQRRRRGAILQHGGLLLRRSPVAPEFPGLRDLATISVDDVELTSQLIQATARVLHGFDDPEAPLEPGSLSETETTRVTELMTNPISVRREATPTVERAETS